MKTYLVLAGWLNIIYAVIAYVLYVVSNNAHGAAILSVFNIIPFTDNKGIFEPIMLSLLVSIFFMLAALNCE